MWTDDNDKIMEIYDLALIPDTVFPVKCPICGSSTGHIYIHRFDEKHGGIWVWCSKCHSFGHISGIIPDWWNNLEGVDENSLESEPEYLDKYAARTDDWVNSLEKKSAKLLNTTEAKIDALGAIANLVGIDYFRNHIEEACESYPTDDFDDEDYEYFLGFEGDEKSGLWTVFARVSVNRRTKMVTFLDYKTPDGIRMENPVKPISFA